MITPEHPDSELTSEFSSANAPKPSAAEVTKVALSESNAETLSSEILKPEPIDKEIQALESQMKDIQAQLRQLEFPKAMTDPRFSETERRRILDYVTQMTRIHLRLTRLQDRKFEIETGLQL